MDGQVAVVVPIYKTSFSSLEEISLRQMFDVLGEHPIRFCAPFGMDVGSYINLAKGYSSLRSLDVDYFPAYFFRNVEGYNRLLVSPIFYKQYERFQFILVHQLDVFVFRDELLKWCEKDYDYIGAPWYNGWGRAKANAPFHGVGNGGFSLRKVSSHLRALHTFSYLIPPSTLIENLLKAPWWQKPKKLVSLIYKLTLSNNTHYLLGTPSGNEDSFWGITVNRSLDWFRVADEQVAMKFSIETQPGRLLQVLGNELPFGCHGWNNRELSFWKPFIRSYGYSIEMTSVKEA